MIKKGMFGVDDYTKFGGLLDTLEKAGGHLFIYSPRKRTITVACKKSKENAVLSVAGERVIKRKEKGGIAYITLKI